MKFNLPFKGIFGKLLYNKRFTIAFSIIFAFVFWMIITIIQNPIRVKSFTNLNVTVPISENTFLTEEKLNIVSDFSHQTFSVEISGPNYLVSSLTSEDFILVASLDTVTSAGTYSLKVNGVTNSSKTGYTFVSVTPSTVDVTFDYIDTKEFTVKPSITDVIAEEGYVADVPVLTKTEHNRIEITGPRSIINQIKSVNAVAKGDANKKIEKTGVYPSSVVLYNENGDVLYTYANDGTVFDAAGNAVKNNYLTLNVKLSDVSITQPIYKETAVPLVAAFTNLPTGVTSDMVVYSITPQKITVAAATPPVEITLNPINWKTINKNNTEKVATVTLPDGVKAVGEIGTITVEIDFEKSKLNFNTAR
ncbi:MAG: hypothetical protein E7562_06125 [Ruminococcaceae bacterium]|nr:hypothetical protein [Oscillospiraceae bacterium]